MHTDEGRDGHRYILLNFRPSSASLAKSVQDGIEAAGGAFTDYGRWLNIDKRKENVPVNPAKYKLTSTSSLKSHIVSNC